MQITIFFFEYLGAQNRHPFTENPPIYLLAIDLCWEIAENMFKNMCEKLIFFF
jgi:hypothetical protein